MTQHTTLRILATALLAACLTLAPLAAVAATVRIIEKRVTGKLERAAYCPGLVGGTCFAYQAYAGATPIAPVYDELPPLSGGKTVSIFAVPYTDEDIAAYAECANADWPSSLDPSWTAVNRVTWVFSKLTKPNASIPAAYVALSGLYGHVYHPETPPVCALKYLGK